MAPSFRIERLDGPEGGPTGAMVFAPPPALPRDPRLLVERAGAENTQLGPHGWAVASRGLKPRRIEKRGDELWLLFGAEVSWYVRPGTAVRVRLPGTELHGDAVWPPIPRGTAPSAPMPEEEDPVPPVVPERPPVRARAEDDGESTVVIRAPVREPDPPPVRRPDPEPPVVNPVLTPPPAPRRLWPWVLLLVLLGVGGGAWWFQDELRAEWDRLMAEPVPPPRPPEPPPRPPEPPPLAADDPCATAPSVLAGRCPSDRLMALPAEAQARLADGLRALGGREAENLAIALLSTASAQRHGPAMLALARLYDPANFLPGGALAAPNRGRALDLYAAALAAGQPEAAALRAALLDRLRREAAGDGPDAAEARDVLRRAGE